VRSDCHRYSLANPTDVANWITSHADLVEPDRIAAWIEQLADDPDSIESERMLDPFGIYGYRTAFIEDQDVDIVFVLVEHSCELYIRRLTHLSEIEEEPIDFPGYREPPAQL
jgi:hypothetical protein